VAVMADACVMPQERPPLPVGALVRVRRNDAHVPVGALGRVMGIVAETSNVRVLVEPDTPHERPVSFLPTQIELARPAAASDLDPAPDPEPEQASKKIATNQTPEYRARMSETMRARRAKRKTEAATVGAAEQAIPADDWGRRAGAALRAVLAEAATAGADGATLRRLLAAVETVEEAA